MKLVDCEDLMNMSDYELEQYAEDLYWMTTCGITQEMAADIEFMEQMIEVELHQR